MSPGNPASTSWDARSSPSNQIKPIARQIDDAAGEPADSAGARRLSRHERVQRMPRPGSQGSTHSQGAVARGGQEVIPPSNSRGSCTTAWASGEREFELMTPTAKARFSHLTRTKCRRSTSSCNLASRKLEKRPEQSLRPLGFCFPVSGVVAAIHRDAGSGDEARVLAREKGDGGSRLLPDGRSARAPCPPSAGWRSRHPRDSCRCRSGPAR